MTRDLLFETNRFNLSQVMPHFINDCCFGEDLGAWLREKLAAERFSTIEPEQEDWGWYIEATHNGQSYFIGIGGNAGENPADPNEGQWRITIQKVRSFMEKLTGRNPMAADERIVSIIRSILEREPDFRNIVEE